MSLALFQRDKTSEQGYEVSFWAKQGQLLEILVGDGGTGGQWRVIADDGG